MFGERAQTRAALPETWGVAIEVPLKKLYVFFGVVLRMYSPGAVTLTVASPQFENDALIPPPPEAATEIRFGEM